MQILFDNILATFTTPEFLNTDIYSLLWLLPLTASIAVVYKATKVANIKVVSFIWESFVLFGSIVIFMIIAAIVLFVFAWFITEKLPSIMG
jgi:hypothetical protein